MSFGLVLLVLFVVCAVIGAVVLLWLKQQQTLQREAFQALAARRGWALTITQQKLGRPANLRLASRSGTGWQAETRLDTGDQDGRVGVLTTVFSAADPHWPDGSLVLTCDSASISLPRKHQAVLSDNAAGLQDFAGPAGLTVRATTDPLFRYDLAAVAKALSAKTPSLSQSKDDLVILITPEGFNVRLGHGMRRADDMEAFIDLALDVIRVL